MGCKAREKQGEALLPEQLRAGRPGHTMLLEDAGQGLWLVKVPLFPAVGYFTAGETSPPLRSASTDLLSMKCLSCKETISCVFICMYQRDQRE